MKNLIVLLIVIFSTISCSTSSSDVIIEEKPVMAQKPTFIKRVALISTVWAQDQALMQYPNAILLVLNDAQTNHLYTEYVAGPTQDCFYKVDHIVTTEWDRGDHYGNLTFQDLGDSFEIVSTSWENWGEGWVNYTITQAFTLTPEDRLIYTYSWNVIQGDYLIRGTSSGTYTLAEYTSVNIDPSFLPLCN